MVGCEKPDQNRVLNNTKHTLKHYPKKTQHDKTQVYTVMQRGPTVCTVLCTAITLKISDVSVPLPGPSSTN